MSTIKVKSNGEHVVVMQMTPHEARLVSEALAVAASNESETGITLTRWYRDLGETLLIQANEAAECKEEETCNHDSLVMH